MSRHAFALLCLGLVCAAGCRSRRGGSSDSTDTPGPDGSVETMADGAVSAIEDAASAQDGARPRADASTPRDGSVAPDMTPAECTDVEYVAEEESLHRTCSSSLPSCLGAATTDAAFRACFESESADCNNCVNYAIGHCVTTDGTCADEAGEFECCVNAVCPTRDSACVQSAMAGACASQNDAYGDCLIANVNNSTCPLIEPACLMESSSIPVGGDTVSECQGVTNIGYSGSDDPQVHTGLAVFSSSISQTNVYAYTRSSIDDYAYGGMTNEYKVRLQLPFVTAPGSYAGVMALSRWNGSSWSNVFDPTSTTLVTIADLQVVDPTGLMCNGVLTGRAEALADSHDLFIFTFSVPILTTSFPRTGSGPP